MEQKRITKIDALPKLQKKTRVAAYARVSTGKDAMLHSLAAQVSNYNKMISEHEGWEFAGVYADEALTGTKDSREEFKKLIERTTFPKKPNGIKVKRICMLLMMIMILLFHLKISKWLKN